MQQPTLDARLAAVAALFPPCDAGADIGADHGRLSCTLLSSGRCQRMQITDISSLSLEKARRSIALCGLDKRADFRVGDGLKALNPPVQCIAICGMGGQTVADILLAAPQNLQGAALVLSPQTENHLVRDAVMRIGYHFTHEQVVLSARRYYLILKAEPGAIQYTDKELRMGPCLMQENGDLYYEYLQHRDRCLRVMQDAGTAVLKQYVQEEIDRVSANRAIL